MGRVGRCPACDDAKDPFSGLPLVLVKSRSGRVLCADCVSTWDTHKPDVSFPLSAEGRAAVQAQLVLDRATILERERGAERAPGH